MPAPGILRSTASGSIPAAAPVTVAFLSTVAATCPGRGIGSARALFPFLLFVLR